MRFLQLSSCFLLLISCQRSASIGDESNILPLPPKYFTNFESKECKDQLGIAQQDVNNGKLVYQVYSLNNFRYSEELEELLAKHEIEFDYLGVNDLGVQECYGYYMENTISKKFGPKFITSPEKPS